MGLAFLTFNAGQWPPADTIAVPNGNHNTLHSLWSPNIPPLSLPRAPSMTLTSSPIAEFDSGRSRTTGTTAMVPTQLANLITHYDRHRKWPGTPETSRSSTAISSLNVPRPTTTTTTTIFAVTPNQSTGTPSGSDPSPSGAPATDSTSATHSGAKASGRSPTGAIVGGVIGGLALVLFVAFATILLRRRLRARHTAPSAEFLNIMRQGGGLGQSGALSPVKGDARSTTPGLYYYSDAAGVSGGGAGSASDHLVHPLARQSSLESDERPPVFTPGAYRDPVLEKARTAAAMREHYFRHESLATMAVTKEEAKLVGRESERDDRGPGRGYTAATQSTIEKEEYA